MMSMNVLKYQKVNIMKITNSEIAKKLGITSRSVQNKRSGNTGWLLSEYMLLIKYYGQDIADEIVNITNTNDKMEEK